MSAWTRAAAIVALFTLSFPAPGVSTVADVTAMPAVGEEVARKDWTWTLVDARGIALGGGGLEQDDVADLHARGFRAVLNYRGEFPHEESTVKAAGMDYLFINSTFAEEDTMTLAEVEASVAFVEESLRAGKPVYVHCTGGWHRSIVGVVGFYMKERGWGFEQAYAHVASLRPGIEPRFADALLAYEAHLQDRDKLTLDIWTSRWDVLPNETVPAHALVTRHGTPVEGARVTFTRERDGVTQEAVSGPDGMAHFEFLVGPRNGSEYVHARASKEGDVDGYDRNVYWIGRERTRAATVIGPLPAEIRAEPGAEVAFEVRVAEADGGVANARLTLTSRCATLHRDDTGWDGRARVAFAAPETPGTYPLRLHAHRFPAEPVFANLTLVVGEGGPEPACEPPPSTLAEVARSAKLPSAWTLGTVLGAFAIVALLGITVRQRQR